ncbi:MAG: aliphatic sulfonate ABC transporter substrate-binding protein [Clostridiales bacterium]|nr:aliphatic sulfonate ABC transporter substrate-binding protein [Clostridiales bacterium]
MKINKAIVCVMLVLAVFFTGGCGCSRNDEGDPEMRIAYFPNITHSQALVMKDQGILEERLGDTCEVTWQAFNAGPAEVEAMFAGEIDLGYIGPVPAVNANVKSYGDFQILCGATDGGSVLVTREGFELTDLSQLSGMTVAIPQLGNTQHLTLLNLLSENGLAPISEGGTVEVVATSNADIMNLIDQGSIDAALVPEPWGSTILRQTGANLALDYDAVWRGGDYSTAVVIVNKDFLEDHEDFVRAFLEAHMEATAFLNENLEEAIPIVNRQIEEVVGRPFDEDILKEAYSRLILTEKLSKESIRDFAKISRSERFIFELPGDNLFNDSLLNELQQ